MRVLVAAVVVVGLAGSAGAENESTKLFEEGRALAEEKKWEEACAKFEKSLELDRAAGTLLNYANCHEKLGHLAQAWRLFDEAARAFDKAVDPERAKFARDRAQALVPRTSTIVVKLAAPDQPGLAVSIGGRPAEPAAEVREVVDPGEVTIEVSGTNLVTFTKRERAEPGLKIVIEVPKLAEVEQREAGVRTQRRRTRVYAAYTLGGVGLASVVTAVLLGMHANSKYDSQFEGNPPPCMRVGDESVCDPSRGGADVQNDAITIANVGTGFGVAGALLIGSAAVVFFTAPKDVVVVPTASASAGGLAVVGRF